MRVVHLNKSGAGWTSHTACGRNLLRTPMSANWSDFKQEPLQFRCIKCATSKQFELNTKMDQRKEPWNHNAPINPSFVGAQPPKLGEDY